jgi:hypothetical protein
MCGSMRAKEKESKQVAADLEVLAEAVLHHVVRVHALARLGVVRAARGVDMMVAAPPAAERRIDPSLNLPAPETAVSVRCAPCAPIQKRYAKSICCGGR